MKSYISLEEGEELQKLYAQFNAATLEAIAALKTGGRPLEGELLQRFVDADSKATGIMRQIKKILGTTGQPWNA